MSKPMMTRGIRRAHGFLTSYATISRLINARDSMAGRTQATELIASLVPASYEPYRLPLGLAEERGRIESRVRFTIELALGTGAMPADRCALDGMTFILTGRQDPNTRSVVEKWIAELLE